MFRNTTAEDVAYVVKNMRPEDVKELWLASGKPAVEALADLGKKPYVAFTLGRDDEPIAIFGATIVPETGVATMFRFATRRWPEVVREAVRIGRRQILPMFKETGVKRVEAHSRVDGDGEWIRLFGAKLVGGYGGTNGAFNVYAVDLAP